MRSFIRDPHDIGEDEDEFVDPDLVEPVFFPVVLVQVEDERESEEEEEEDDAEGVVARNMHPNPPAPIRAPIEVIDEDESDSEGEEEEDDGVEVIIARDRDANPPAPILVPIPIEVSDASINNGSGTAENTDDNTPGIIQLPSPSRPSITGTTESPAPSAPPTPIINSVGTENNNGNVPSPEDADLTAGIYSNSSFETDAIVPEPDSADVSFEIQVGVKRSHDPAHADSGTDPKRPLTQKEEDESSQGQTEDEIYSNPLVSAEDGAVDLDEEALRGDRIGQTIYSERHILRILMKWIEELPKYSSAGDITTQAVRHVEEDEECESKKLEREFKKELSLLWDMSSEADVMTYLVSKGIFGILRESLVASRCERLTEITLGILANVLSSGEITEQLAREDRFLKLVQTAISIGSGTSSVPILLQVLAVLRRITWYMGHVAIVDRWISDTVASPEFHTMVTLILKGSTNRVLIKDSVMVIFALLETLVPDGDEEKGGNGPTIDTRVEGLCTATLVAALCEGLQELLKIPEGEVAMVELIDDVQRIPSHLQLGLRSGLGVLCYIQKIPSGRVAIRAEKEAVMGFAVDFFSEFAKMTDDIQKGNAVEYFVAGLSLLVFCHMEFSTVQPNALLRPVAAAQELMRDENQENVAVTRMSSEVGEGTSSNSLILALALSDHLAQIRLKFGAEEVLGVLEEDEKTNGMLRFLTQIEEIATVNRLKEKERVVLDP